LIIILFKKEKKLNKNEIYEDEIDLRELFQIIWNKRIFVVFFTLLVTLLAVVYSFSVTKIYEVKSNIQIGYMNDKLLIESDTLSKTINLLYYEQNNNKNEAYLEKVSIDKKANNFLTIITHGMSNEKALKKNKEIVEFVKQQNKKDIDNYIFTLNQSIEKNKNLIQKINTKEKSDLKRSIELLMTQEIKKIDELIFQKNRIIESLNEKIKFTSMKLDEYNNQIQKLFRLAQTKSDTMAMIASIQMVNYQNLILDAQEKLQNYKLKIENIKNLEIVDLKRKKENISTDKLKNLKYRLDITLNEKIKDLEFKIKELQFQKENSIKNTSLIGDYIISETPIKPKKKLIVTIAFVTGFILSIFLVFFMQFVSGMRKEK
jgi:capsular polysaccharide biosynthesis protein